MMTGPNHDIKYLFEPQAIAVIGATRDPNKIGYKVELLKKLCQKHLDLSAITGS
jgi:predicted CoA-binding protein